MNYVTKLALTLLAAAALTGCNTTPVKPESSEPTKLVVNEDGTMEYGDRLVANEDVIIYPDGYGGERAAIKIWLEPLHPAFYRDSIAVERK